MIRLAKPLLGEAEEQAVAEVLRSGWLVQGPKVAEFESLLAASIGVNHVIACSSGTAALQLALAAAEFEPGQRIAVPAYTFPATINAVLLAGLVPVLIDIDPSTFNLDADDLERVLPDVDGVMPVHQFGLPSPIEGLSERTRVVEDAACALGASLGGRQAGGLGVMGCFSFHPRKIITTGEGGAISTDDAALADKLRLLRNHGMARNDDGTRSFSEPGWNFRLSEIHAAIGICQMDRLDGLLQDRTRIADGYEERLAPLRQLGLELPRVPQDAVPTWQSYVVRVPRGRSVPSFIAHLCEAGVEATTGATALHREPAYADLEGCQRPMPGTDDAADRALALPVASGLSDDELDAVADALGGAIQAAI
ncbi:MAG: DegT/DnrJ/EryC1/StrS family aminotransferase [Proteobacteria bacterium]|nr:DegT/DnrJ/EryC1/StrS family aminotransferase [Pseudomonadota bacterium]